MLSFVDSLTLALTDVFADALADVLSMALVFAAAFALVSIRKLSIAFGVVLNFIMQLIGNEFFARWWMLVMAIVGGRGGGWVGADVEEEVDRDVDSEN